MELRLIFKEIIIIDHHKTLLTTIKKNELNQQIYEGNITLIIDLQQSASNIVFRYLLDYI